MRAVDRTHVEAIALEPVDALTVTTLVDNVTDSLLPDQGPARRPSMAAAPRRPAPLLAGGNTDDALRAEHGFSVLVTITKEGRETRVLFDAGRTPDGLVENMRRLDLPPADIDIIVLSHGHWDHVTGMDGLVGRLGRASMPTLIHPEFWTRRRLAFPARDPFELPLYEQERSARSRLRDRRAAPAVLPARRLAAGDRRS
jgi:7,8-dihydropterin-6-yl-methyl-4-(beta-D-ribofuranosyl)aminobenzene 5'-phosphate synthase